MKPDEARIPHGSASAPAPGGGLSSLLLELASAPDRVLVDAFERGLAPGQVVGRFEIQRELGRGGFGVVYEARDCDLGRLVAFKAIRPGARDSARLREERLLREAEAAARLSHPNIVVLFDYGRWEGGPYLVLERLRGRTLAERLQEGTLPPRQAVGIAVGVARALVHAHAAGVLHRDLKPGNVFLGDDGVVKVLDFGLAHLFGAGGPAAGGTPGYMAPEQWREEPEDARTDVFALGVLLFEMLAGSPPYDVSRSGRRAVLQPGPPPPLAAPGVPRRLAALVGRAIAKDPAERPETAQALLDDLAPLERSLERKGGRRATAGVLAALAAAAAVALALRARPPAPPPPGEPLAVAVADVANDTGERVLDGLSGLLITSLEQSRRLHVVTRSRMIDVVRQIGREDAERIDEPLAREIGRRIGVRALLIGSIRRFDGNYSLELRALDPVADEYLFAVNEQAAGRAAIPGLIDRISERARERLREKSEEIRESAVKVSEAVTPSLEAHQHYFLGLDCMERPSRHPGHPKTCLEEFRRAVAIDPGFAQAWFQLSRAGWQELAPTAEDRAAIAEALRHADRVPPKERNLMRAWSAHLAGRDEEAIALYRQVVEAFPQDKQALFLAGDLAWHRDDHAAARPYLARVLDLDPSHDFALDHLSYSLAILGLREELRGWVERWSAMAPTPPVLHAITQAQAGLGDARAAAATARRALEVSPLSFALVDLLRVLAFAGDYPELEKELAPRLSALPVLYRYYQANALAATGRRAEALRVLEAVARNPPDADARRDATFIRAVHLAGDGDAAALWAAARSLRPIDARFAAQLAFYLARSGDLEHARELAAGLAPGSPHRELYLAVLDWKEGRPARARARLEALETRYPLLRGGIAPAFLLAEVAAAEGLDAAAVEALRRLERLPFQPYWRSWTYPRSLFLLARSLDRLGRRAEARASVARLLALWSRADPGLPLLREARALQERLGPPDTPKGHPGKREEDGGSRSGVEPR